MNSRKVARALHQIGKGIVLLSEAVIEGERFDILKEHMPAFAEEVVKAARAAAKYPDTESDEDS